MSAERDIAAEVAAQLERERGGNVWDLDRPLDAARVYLREKHTNPAGERTAFTHSGVVHVYERGKYAPLDEHDLQADLYEYFSRSPKGVNSRKVAEVIAAMKAASNLRATVTFPAWLDRKEADPPPEHLISCRNGLVDARTGALLKATPRFATLHALPFDYAPDASCERWRAFLDELWGNDNESKQLLREWFGLCLVPVTRYQKALLLHGPKRSGKGTIIRVLRALVGAYNCCSPTLTSLGQRFALESWIGKLLAVISDARISSRADKAAIAEMVLRVVGEDPITIERKFKTDITMTLAARLMVVSNELPRFDDDAGALPSRFITLGLTRSFFGEEDTALTDKLLEELPGILNWAIGGLDALNERGRFIQPEAGRELSEELEVLASPVRAFLDERFVVDASAETPFPTVWDEWKAWCDDQKRKPGGSAQLGNSLRSILPSIPKKLPQRTGVLRPEKKDRVVPGIRVRRPFDG